MFDRLLSNDAILGRLYTDADRLTKRLALAMAGIKAAEDMSDDDAYDIASEQYDIINDELIECNAEIERLEGQCARYAESSLRTW